MLLRRYTIGCLLITAMTTVVPGAGCTSRPPLISIEGSRAELSPAFLGVASVYMKVRNEGGGDAILAASVNIPNAVVELHDVRNNRMTKVDRISIPAGDTVELKAGSLHIMIFNLPSTLKEGAALSLLLRFARSGERQVQVRLAPPGSQPGQG